MKIYPRRLRYVHGNIKHNVYNRYGEMIVHVCGKRNNQTKQPTLQIPNQVEMKEITMNRQSEQKPTLKSNTISMAIINLLHFNSVWQVRVVLRDGNLNDITLQSNRYSPVGCVHFSNRQLCINKIELTCRILSGSFPLNFRTKWNSIKKYGQNFHNYFIFYANQFKFHGIVVELKSLKFVSNSLKWLSSSLPVPVHPPIPVEHIFNKNKICKTFSELYTHPYFVCQIR